MSAYTAKNADTKPERMNAVYFWELTTGILECLQFLIRHMHDATPLLSYHGHAVFSHLLRLSACLACKTVADTT